MEAFLKCSQTQRPDNTLFPDIVAVNVGYTDMVNYMDLILGLFEISPEGHLAICNSKHRHENMIEISDAPVHRRIQLSIAY